MQQVLNKCLCTEESQAIETCKPSIHPKNTQVCSQLFGLPPPPAYLPLNVRTPALAAPHLHRVLQPLLNFKSRCPSTTSAHSPHFC